MSATYTLARNVHLTLPSPTNNSKMKYIKTVRGDYEYWHYVCDDFDDRGFGCGYRTLQTICSWIKQFKSPSVKNLEVPSILKIQELLVEMEDKPTSIIDSREWIGSFEVCLILDKLYDIPCKIKHLSSGKEIKNQIADLFDHFEKFGSPIMMGGDQDASSKGVFGVASSNDNQHYLLIIDPHYHGKPITNVEDLYRKSWVTWKPINEFMDSSFYNMCMPQIAAPLEGATKNHNKPSSADAT